MSLARAVLLSCAAALPSCAVFVGESDREPPALTVTSPERAARLESNAVTVGGRASDAGSGVEAVTVNGVAAAVADDGAFRAELALEGGVSLIDVVVRDRAGNQTRDVRAVLSGRRSAESLIAGGLMARVSPEGYGLVAEGVRALLTASDLGAAAAAPGAVMSVPGCFEVDVVGLQHGAIDVELEPRADGVGLAVDVSDVVVDLAVDVGGLCGVAGSGGPARLRADELHLTGLARPVAASGRVTLDLGGLAADLEGADLDTTLVPAGVVDLLADAPSEIADTLGGAIGGLAGDLLGDSLGQLDATEWSTDIDGLAVTVRLAPTSMDAGVEGLAVTSSVELRFADLGDPVEYAAGAAPAASALDTGGPLRLAVADDVVNLLLSALWRSGRLDRAVVVPEDHPARTRLGLDRLEIALALPPTVTGREGSARVIVGDAVVTAFDLGGEAVMRLAVSAAVDLALSAGGGGALTPVPGATELWIAPLDGDGGSAATFEVPEPLRLAALDQVTRFLEESLGSLPVPELTGVARISGLAGLPGYVVLDADLVRP